MRFNRRLEKIEGKLAPDDQIPQVLLTFSDEDEQEQIEAFLAENPGQPYEIIRKKSVTPNKTYE